MGSKSGSPESFTPDYSILENPSNHDVYNQAKKSGKRFLICKEELGNSSRKGECLYDVFPTPSTYTTVRPVFLVRDPIRVFDSWKNVGWTDVQSLVDCYDNMQRMLREAIFPKVSCLIYERLVEEPEAEVKRICGRWGVPFSESMLDFKKPFGSAFVYASERERSIYCEEKPLGLFATVETHDGIEADVPCHGLLSNAEKDTIEEHVGRQYLRCWQHDVDRLRAILAEKSWFGFDLDDTLHEFRKASGVATSAVLEEISRKSGIALPQLKEEYAKVLKEKTANAFSDGKTSFDYRKERFTAVLTHFSLPTDEHFLTTLLQLYEETLTTSLELKSGALALLSTLKAHGKIIIIMTEGPQDAQERTVAALGLGPYVDFLATTNHFRVSKIDGLFAKVLKHLNISPGDIAYVGDNELRDMKPAMAEGVFCVHFAEGRNVSLTAYPVRINTLRKLQYVLEGE
ncbi:Haloacid dehalogenase-like hydrolase [Aulographum hederae CBS 113979]|uniref:Haloacid dehalogenase-like hydrolase n=1 Tax=Aulographum hederae CBS 113979 TaxID=1176131 RepID=A0A6G1H5J9_9PEZI|nr:Haloacid dehalogenase-like hydrolase [Aulographum hederae CBS 113979]